MFSEKKKTKTKLENKKRNPGGDQEKAEKRPLTFDQKKACESTGVAGEKGLSLHINQQGITHTALRPEGGNLSLGIAISAEVKKGGSGRGGVGGLWGGFLSPL